MERRKYYIIAAAALVLIIVFSVIFLQMQRKDNPVDVNQNENKNDNTSSNTQTSADIDAIETISIEQEVERLLKEIVENGPKDISGYPEYLKNNSSFEKLVALGRPALEYMFELFKKSGGDELKEYVMACASAKIMGIYNEENAIGNTSGREWFYQYGEYEEQNALNVVDEDVNQYKKGEDVGGITLPEGVDRTNLEDVISNYILAWNRSFYKIGEKAIEAHKIYKDEVKDDVTTIYMLVRFAWFEFANDVFTPVEDNQAAPVVMQLRSTENGYEPLGYKQSLGGAYLEQSVAKMFPEDIRKLVLDEYEKVDKELKDEQVKKAKEYLAKLNRSDVPIGEVDKNVEDENMRKAIYLVQRTRPDFPDWNGTREILVSAGEKFNGAKIQCTLETKAEKSGDFYIVTLTRRWGIEIMGEKPVSYWRYKVEGDKVELIETVDNDPVILLQ
ncbi:MAG: hypothetical protein GX066_07765 [Clostridiaceae bacterium]|nr:hypothetical protein [Clostridiaceae bacterium]